MNDVFEKISKTITDTGKVVGEKTKQVSEVAKLNARIISAEHAISEYYTVLGKLCYDTSKDNPDESTAETVNKITAEIDSIAEMRAQILSIKGMVKCQGCEADCPIENSYCGKCGALLEKPVFEEEAPADVIVVDAAEAPAEEAEEEKTEE